MEKPRIRFINALSETLFFIEDGKELEIDIGGGETQRYVCRYIDEYHAWIGDRVYHIREFAEMMERNIRTYRPAKQEKINDLTGSTPILSYILPGKTVQRFYGSDAYRNLEDS